ncbi:MAG TPA: hypothetical protein VF139_06610 [Candidatus Polarisedimenticolaceae bacterium]
MGVPGNSQDFVDLGRARGRALWVSEGGTLHVARRHTVLRSEDLGKRWVVDCVVPAAAWRRAACAPRLLARLFRHDVQAFVVRRDGSRLAVARDGVYLARHGETAMQRVFAFQRGSRPINLSVHPSGRVLFGEYGDNAERREVHVYASDDGRHFEVAYTFPAGEIRHVHNLIWDPHLGSYWVLVGDYRHEPGVGLFDADLSRVTWVLRGTQHARAVGAIVEPDALIFGTDSETEPNAIIRLEKATGRTTTLAAIPGSSLYAARFGDLRVVSTCVEPSRVNPDRSACVFVSRDGADWRPAARYRKDPWSLRYFQFGTVVLPQAEGRAPVAMFSGQAVAGFDDRVRIVALHAP